MTLTTTTKLFALAALLGLTGACLRPPPVEGAPCPCPAGFACNASRQCEALVASACACGPGSACNAAGQCQPAGDASSDLAPAAACVDIRPTPPARRLRADEYRNTVHDLLGITVTEELPVDPAPGADDPTAAVPDAYRTLAGLLATRASAKGASLVPCDPATAGPSPCGQMFIDQLVPRAWRRPLTEDERASLRATFAGALPLGFDKAITATLTAVLASPSFVLRLERGDRAAPAPHAVPLTAWEIATRLSYLMWRTMPDEPLFAAARSGALATRAGVRAEAQRLLDDPRAGQMLAGFQRHWLQLDAQPDDAAPASLVSPELRATIALSADQTVNQLWRDGGEGTGDLRTLLTWPKVLADGAMASFFDLQKPTSGGMEMLMPLGDQRRFGLLTTPAFLSTFGHAEQSAPVRRGVVVRDAFLCLPSPGPPMGITVPLSSPIRTGTTRDLYYQHSHDPACSSCHTVFDPVGFGLENYDGYGRWRDLDQGMTVDASGAVEGKSFDGPGGLASLLATDPQISRDVSSCLVTQWFRYAFERPEGSTKEDQCTIEAIHAELAGSGFKVRALLLALATSDAFLTLSVGH